ncbi:MAG: HsdR family type I site-specific deoxyribonuclease [Paludibacter sp.]|nr:HsdR family type I site-specific deoxyribonuclease [Paludibacter sp.]
MENFNEAAFEQAFIELLKNTGWTYTDGESIHRRPQDILLEDDLRTYLTRRFSTEHLTEREIKSIITDIRLENAPSFYNANRNIFHLICNGEYWQRDDTSLPNLRVPYIDFEHTENNIYRCVNQYTVKQNAERRPDILLFINGIPMAIIELKSAVKEDTTIANAWQQIHNRYIRDIPTLLRYCSLSIISDGANARLGTLFTPYDYYYAWKKVENEDESSLGIKENITLIDGALAPERLTEIIRDYVYYPDPSDNKQLEIVCRYPQFFATRKLFNHIRQQLRSQGGDGKGGTYFGATGCGKTYTMLFLARQLALRDTEIFGNPTIIIITDREDLDTQASQLFVNSKTFLNEENVRSIESRQDMKNELGSRNSGGVFITTIQKFCADTGLLSDRSNIICISDEAHRTQTNTSGQLDIDVERGVRTTFGFAKYLRDSFPNATYVGFTGTPIDETIHVFGQVVDKYTMKESCEDKITVPITYEPRLARVLLNEEQSHEIEKYYQQCEEEGSNTEQIEQSKQAMSRMKQILSHPERLRKLANDMAVHYEKLCNEKPHIVQKAMIVCADRSIAYQLYNEIKAIRPDWFVKKKCEDESLLSKEQLEQLKSLAKVNIVATRDKDDPKEMHELLGNKKHRTMLDTQFKMDESNFQIAIVVDMWITGFDVPSLAVMYIDKPLQRHTLIQTISRVNRTYPGKDRGLVVDYIGIKENMLKAIKQYGGDDDSNIDDIQATLKILRNHIELIDNLMHDFDASDFFQSQNALSRLHCLNRAAEYVMVNQDNQTRYMGLSKRLKLSYDISFPSGLMTDTETEKTQFYLAVRSIIYKHTRGAAPDAETMNKHVEQMVQEAISCNGVEDIVNASGAEDIFSQKFEKEVLDAKMPMTKYNALLKLLKKAINQYRRTNKAKAEEFNEMLKKVVEKYNSRDNLVFTNGVVADFVDSLSDELIGIFEQLKDDKNSFEKLGITFEEKAFYDILVKIRDTHHFDYENDKCVLLAKAIKNLVDDKAEYVDWSNRSDIKDSLRWDLTILLYQNGYPPQWNEEVYAQVLEQAENFKKYSE